MNARQDFAGLATAHDQPEKKVPGHACTSLRRSISVARINIENISLGLLY